jgi:DNA-binding NarL/FixJ family response regulator
MDILRLVRAGISNRRIAEQLFLSPRTVETHVANMVRKLGLDGRTQLVAFAEEAIDG